VDTHLFEDRTLVYTWILACSGEKEEGEFRCKTGKTRLRKTKQNNNNKTDSVSIRFAVSLFFKLELEDA
jgi:hypothetical protein